MLPDDILPDDILQRIVLVDPTQTNVWNIPEGEVLKLRLINRSQARILRCRVVVRGPPSALVDEINVERLFLSPNSNDYMNAYTMLYNYKQNFSHEQHEQNERRRKQEPRWSADIQNIEEIIRLLIQLAERITDRPNEDFAPAEKFAMFVWRRFKYLETKQRSRVVNNKTEREYVTIPELFTRVRSGMRLQTNGFNAIALTEYGRWLRLA